MAAPKFNRIQAGEIRQMRGWPVERLVLVLKPDGKTVQITLVHPYTEYATQNDAIIEPHLSGLHYDLLVETDLAGVVFADELGAVVATLSSETLTACYESDDSIYFGPPMIGPLDSRWGFKIEEGETMRQLSSNALSKLLSEKEK